ncbi:hypothetical protein [Paracraurococcus lichenis]|uniref:DUF3168 domain-containing protein n=1 Tax=Paracraurococcus lichenis TaxID=3064888 RepID=A0ABT9E8B8_9PROT|nr:hypothetical protein [Paracraurococcus sp. LOR1-02]MDO9712453.1 hypothetical protein [Paracraurococcus sp. LOR1-02]
MNAATQVAAALAKYGRPMPLQRRQTGGTVVDVDVNCLMRSFRPTELIGGIQIGDAQVIADAAPLIAAGLGQPKKSDLMTIDGRVWIVQNATPRAIGATVLAYDVWVRGG